jgi:DNA topoisomerase-2
MAKQKSIETKYQKLTDVEHVLLRPSMYIGSVAIHTGDQYLYDGEKVRIEEVHYNPGFIKIFDEIVSNSVDEHRRNPKLNEIRITINLDTTEISVWDNGGIPVEKHPVHKEWIPEMIFSNLKAGSNFDDSEQRTVAGTNGVGSTLTNIFSKKFSVSTCDGINKFEQTFTDNMGKRSSAKINPAKRGFTEISFFPDLERFKMKIIDENSFQILFKRCLDLVGCNNKLTLKLTKIKDGKKQDFLLRFKSFEEYIQLYASEYFFEETKNWKIGFAKSENGFQNVSFVNSVHTKDGGTHVEYITNQLISQLREMIKKKHRVDVKPSDIRNHLHVFIDSTIVNSFFSSQTKEKLITEIKDFGTKHEVTDKIAKLVFKSEIIQSVLDWIEKKQLAEERAELRKLNKSLDKGRIPKLIDAQKKEDRKKCILGIYEGMSALSAFRKFRDTQLMGAYPLKGKFINVHELPNSKVIQNEEVKGLMGSIGLKLGEDPNNLRYGKIYIYTDADPDGNSIAAQLINFFAKYWPEMFGTGIIYKVMTPLVVAKKGNQVQNFYTNQEFENWLHKKSTNTSSWNIEYKKGLAALEDDEYENIIKNPFVVQLKLDKEAGNSLESWFGADSQPRKEKLLNTEIYESN